MRGAGGVIAAIACLAAAPARAGGSLAHLFAEARKDQGRFEAPLADGTRAVLTLEPVIQDHVEKLLRYYRPPYGAVVAIEPQSGRVLALAAHDERDQDRGRALERMLKPEFPAASLFKVVAAAALIDAGISPEMRVCYHGGLRRITERQIRDDARRDRTCSTLTSAMARSINAVFAKLAARYLDAASLALWSQQFLFGQPLRVVPGGYAGPSIANIPVEPLDLGRTAAGFGDVYISPLHAAVIAAAIANDGVAIEPTLVEGADALAAQREFKVMDEDVAGALTAMMVETVRRGTARIHFRERRRWVIPGVEVAAKTGSIFGRRPFRDHSWFIGFAPAEDPRIAVAVLLVNGYHWRIKAPWLGREAMRVYLGDRRTASLDRDRR